jgi:hypothetical protein
MTANELADFVEISKPNDKTHQTISAMLRQQAQEIEALKKKNEDRDSAIHATGYWKGVEYKRMRELTDAEIMEIYDRVELYNIDEGQMYLKPIEFAKELLKKASEK